MSRVDFFLFTLIWLHFVCHVQAEIPFFIYNFSSSAIIERCVAEIWTATGKTWQNFSKTGPEIHFVDVLNQHPWRRTNAEDAVIFVVPLPIGFIARTGCGGEQLLENITNELTASSAFSRHEGRDHIMLSTDFLGYKIAWRMKKLLQNMTLALEEVKASTKYPFRCTIATPYGAVPISGSEKDHQRKPRYTFFFMGQADGREAYATRRRAIESLSELNVSNVLLAVPQSRLYPPCERGQLTRCSVAPDSQRYSMLLSQSKFNLMIRGDTWTTSRLYDAILRDRLSIVLSDGINRFGLPFRQEVPWESFILQIDQAAFMHHPIETILSVSNLTSEELAIKLNLQRKNKPDLLWGYFESKVAENVLRNAVRKCLPATYWRSKLDYRALYSKQ